MHKRAHLFLITTIIAIIVCCGCSTQHPPSSVEVVDCEGAWEAPEAVREIGETSVKQTLVDADGNRYELYPTFDDRDAAVASAASRAPRVLALLGDAYGLEPLSDSNWRRYAEALLGMGSRDDCPEWYGEGSEEYRILRTFFDIYEGYDLNAEVVSTAQDQGIEKAKLLLPDHE